MQIRGADLRKCTRTGAGDLQRHNISTTLVFLAFASEGGIYGDMFGILMFVVPLLLFFAGAIWVCKALLDRLRR